MKLYYVYVYKDEEDDIVYVGRGQRDRAWVAQATRGDTEERTQWKNEQLEKGRLPCDWVEIIGRGLSKLEAMQMEKDMIVSYEPYLNRDLNPAYTSVPRALIKEAVALRETGKSYNKIGEQMGFHTMTVYRWINELNR